MDAAGGPAYQLEHKDPRRIYIFLMLSRDYVTFSPLMVEKLQVKKPIYQRILKQPSKSFFLFGPRGTGKTTWLKSKKFDLWIDLLNSRNRIELQRDPHRLAEMTSHLEPGQWVVIDEVQKIPALLDEVHAIYESQGLNFALSGSSARKLRRVQANLLAGRALNHRLYPLTATECPSAVTIDDRIQWGTLPLVLDNLEHKETTLETYLENYLRQELVEEGIVRNLDPFLRFLQVAGMMNGQILNVESIARDAHVGRTTVDKYFEVLYDTLVAWRLPAYQPGVKAREVAHPKVYFFDPGVARVAAGQTRQDLDSVQLGFQFETWLIGELRAYNDYAERHCDIFYYALSGGGDIDLVIRTQVKTISHPEKIILLEFKNATNWKQEWCDTLNSLDESLGRGIVQRKIGIYRGNQRRIIKSVDVVPVTDFLKDVFAGKVW